MVVLLGVISIVASDLAEPTNQIEWYIESDGRWDDGRRLRWVVGHEIVNASKEVIDKLILSCYDSRTEQVPVDD